MIKHHIKKVVGRPLWRIGIFFPPLHHVMGKPLTRVTIDQLRCHKNAFSESFERLGPGQTIEHVVQYRFFEISLTHPDKAYEAYYEWLQKGLLEKQLWKIHRLEGGWANGSLVKCVFQIHQEQGILLMDFAQADPKLIDKAIRRRARYYLNLFNSIKQKGYNRSLYPPITCSAEDGYYMLHNGHHRVAALHLLGFQEVDIVIIQKRLYRKEQT